MIADDDEQEMKMAAATTSKTDVLNTLPNEYSCSGI
jgi:hypothetical protein